MKEYVLDTFAMLSYFGNEKGADHIERLLHNAKRGKIHLFLNLINIGEIYYITARETNLNQADEVIARIKRFPVNIVSNDERLTLMAARIKAVNPLSYADAFVAATAKDRNAAVVTGDAEFKNIENLVEIFWI